MKTNKFYFSFLIWLLLPALAESQAPPLGMTSSDKSRLEYEIKTPREAWTQMRLHQFLSDNPKAVYLLDNYEQQEKTSIRDLNIALKRTEEDDFYQDMLQSVLPDRIKTSVTAHAGFKREIAGFSFGGQASISADKIWNSEKLVKNYFSKDYIQTQDGSFVNKISAYSKNLTHDIYECEKNAVSCRINADPAFQHLYQRILKQNFPDFPEFEKTVQGQKNYISFEDMKRIDPKNASFVETLFTSQKTLKTAEEIKTSVLGQIRRENTRLKQTAEQFENNQINQALQIAGSKDQQLTKLEGELSFLENSLQTLQSQRDQGSISKEDFNKKTEKIKKGIQNQKNKIEERKTAVQINKFIKPLDISQKWVNAVTSLAGFTGAPKEVIQAGRAVSAGIDIFKGLGPMLIAGAFDPTGITLAINGAAALFAVFSDPGPSIDQIILDELSIIKSNQVKMIRLLYKIDSQFAGIKDQLKNLENLLNKNHKEIISSLERIEDDLLDIAGEMYIAFERQNTATNELLRQNTNNADVANETASYSNHHKTLDELYRECQFYYRNSIEIINNRNLKLAQTNACLDLCLTEQTKKDGIGVTDSCEKICPAPKDADCDSNCIRMIIEQKLYTRRYYQDCRFRVSLELQKLESDLKGTFKDTEKIDEGTFVVNTNQTELDPNEVIQIIPSGIESRINTIPLVGQTMKKSTGDIVNSGQAENLQSLWTESKLTKYQTAVNEAGRLKNPYYLDDSFSTYVDSLLRLPRPETPIGIDGERYQYDTKNLQQMCQEVQEIENISTASRDNIQNAFALLIFTAGKLVENMQTEFDDYVEILIEDYDNNINKQKEKTANTKNTAETKCNCSKDYTGYLTGVKNHIQNISTVDFFTKTPSETAESIVKKLSNKEITEMGFKKITRFEEQCKSYKKQKKITSAHIETPAQLEMLKDTLEAVQNGEQGGCWFTDNYGLITGREGEKIQLYQMTGIDEFGNPALEPMCAVFVTDLDGKWFFVWKWSEPTKRAICLHARLDFLYNEDFFTNPEKTIYYLTEEEVLASAKPRPISTQKYLRNKFDFIVPDLDVETQQEIIHSPLVETVIVPDLNPEETQKRMTDSRTDQGILSLMIKKYYDTSKWITNRSMKIDTTDNRENIGDQQWVNNIYRNTDSYGRCYKDQYACIKAKDVPIYTADQKGWLQQAEKELDEVKTGLENKIKSSSTVNFRAKTKELIQMWYNLDTLIKAGYGTAQIENNLKLRDLNMILQEINKYAPNLNSESFSDQLTAVKNLNLILSVVDERLVENNYSDSTRPLLIPLFSVENYGFGLPARRTSALEKLKQRKDLQPKQCLYRENI